jgi:phosphopentomutase
MLVGEYNVGRVIARPFNGTSGNYTRTGNRRDFSVDPPEDTILDGLVKAGKNVIGVGKIEDIFDNHGLTESNHTKNNHDSFDAALNYVKSGKGELIFANLVDFDMLYGHRNDVEGYAEALETFDKRLPELMSALADGDMLIITADHGCDPTTPGTDHSREFVPILVYGRLIKRGINIGVRDSFADIGATVYEYITDRDWTSGKSFLDRIIREDTVNE